jgi:hypothetical protein
MANPKHGAILSQGPIVAIGLQGPDHLAGCQIKSGDTIGSFAHARYFADKDRGKLLWRVLREKLLPRHRGMASGQPCDFELANA